MKLIERYKRKIGIVSPSRLHAESMQQCDYKLISDDWGHEEWEINFKKVFEGICDKLGVNENVNNKR